jgi:hypothetical protein
MFLCSVSNANGGTRMYLPGFSEKWFVGKYGGTHSVYFAPSAFIISFHRSNISLTNASSSAESPSGYLGGFHAVTVFHKTGVVSWWTACDVVASDAQVPCDEERVRYSAMIARISSGRRRVSSIVSTRRQHIVVWSKERTNLENSCLRLHRYLVFQSGLRIPISLAGSRR